MNRDKVSLFNWKRTSPWRTHDLHSQPSNVAIKKTQNTLLLKTHELQVAIILTIHQIQVYFLTHQLYAKMVAWFYGRRHAPAPHPLLYSNNRWPLDTCRHVTWTVGHTSIGSVHVLGCERAWKGASLGADEPTGWWGLLWIANQHLSNKIGS